MEREKMAKLEEAKKTRERAMHEKKLKQVEEEQVSPPSRHLRKAKAKSVFGLFVVVVLGGA